MKKLEKTDFSWHADQPDVPNMSAAGMKAFLDAPILTLMNKLNKIIGGDESKSLAELLAAVVDLQNTKQDTLIAGAGISILDNVISATVINELDGDITTGDLPAGFGVVTAENGIYLQLQEAEVYGEKPLYLPCRSVVLCGRVESVPTQLLIFVLLGEHESTDADGYCIENTGLDTDYVREIRFGGTGYTAGEGIAIENGVISLSVASAEGGSY